MKNLNYEHEKIDDKREWYIVGNTVVAMKGVDLNIGYCYLILI